MSNGLYIHIPFCARKCPYCDFYSVTDRSLAVAYADTVVNEISKLDCGFDTIFIGGGTPTSIGDELLKICSAAPKTNEFTVEANPGTVDLSFLKALKKCGVNRISFGVQSFNDNELAALGRIHSASEAETAFELARSAGFGNINIDLMLSTPYQTLESAKRTLETVKRLSPEHVSAYSLIIEEGTPFYDVTLPLPDEDEEREIYYMTVEFLKNIGLYQYEISNFAKRDFQCRHNIKYWTLEPYIGIGAGAASYFGGFRYRNASDIKLYIGGGGRGIEREEITPDERLRERFWLGLRMTEGIEYNGEFPNEVNKLTKNGLLEHHCGKIRLTKRGLDLANVVFSEFV